MAAQLPRLLVEAARTVGYVQVDLAGERNKLALEGRFRIVNQHQIDVAAAPQQRIPAGQ